MTAPQVLADLLDADRLMGAAGRALEAWRHPSPTEPGDRVRAGNDAIDQIDALTRELHVQRSRLVDELHEDDIERNARVDALLATFRAERSAREPDVFSEDGAQ